MREGRGGTLWLAQSNQTTGQSNCPLRLTAYPAHLPGPTVAHIKLQACRCTHTAQPHTAIQVMDLGENLHFLKTNHNHRKLRWDCRITMSREWGWRLSSSDTSIPVLNFLVRSKLRTLWMTKWVPYFCSHKTLTLLTTSFLAIRKKGPTKHLYYQRCANAIQGNKQRSSRRGPASTILYLRPAVHRRQRIRSPRCNVRPRWGEYLYLYGRWRLG